MTQVLPPHTHLRLLAVSVVRNVSELRFTVVCFLSYYFTDLRKIDDGSDTNYATV